MICDHHHLKRRGAVPLGDSVSGAGQAEHLPALTELGPAAKLENAKRELSALRRSRFTDWTELVFTLASVKRCGGRAWGVAHARAL